MADTLFTHGPTYTTSLLASTLENRRGELQDQIFDEMPTSEAIKAKSMIEIRGGASLVGSLMYEGNSTAQWFDGYDILNTAAQDGLTTFQNTWKESAVSVAVSNREEKVQNLGDSAVLNLVDTKINQAKMQLKKLVNDAFYTAAPASTAPDSLPVIILGSGSHGQINGTTYSWWASTVTTGGSFAAQGRSDMLTTYNTLAVEGARTNLILTTPTVHAYYEGSLVPVIRYTDNSKGDASFENLTFKNVAIIADNACTSGVMYFIDSRHIKLAVASENNMSMTEWVKPSNQVARVAQIVFTCSLYTDNRRRLGKITSITA